MPIECNQLRGSLSALQDTYSIKGSVSWLSYFLGKLFLDRDKKETRLGLKKERRVIDVARGICKLFSLWIQSQASC